MRITGRPADQDSSGRYEGGRFLQVLSLVQYLRSIEAPSESHIGYVTYLEGLPRIRYDNMKVAVQNLLHGRNRKEQSSWGAFRSHFLFDAEHCNPAKR
jgi:hypothetical protein